VRARAPAPGSHSTAAAAAAGAALSALEQGGHAVPADGGWRADVLRHSTSGDS
jgi:hypothetical protein